MRIARVDRPLGTAAVLAQLATAETGTIVAVIERFVDGVEWIACIEMWSEPAAVWPPMDDQPHVTELVLEVSL